MTTIMIRSTKQLLALCATVLFGSAFFGCSSTTAPTTTADAPTNVMVSSRSSSSIAVKWRRGTTDLSPDTIMATPVTGGTTTGSAMVTLAVSATDTMGVLVGLADGQLYNITVNGGGGTSAAITWAPADRLPTSGTWRIYETADNTPGHFSGLILSGANAGPASTVGANKAQIDLVLASDVAAGYPFISLASPDVTSLTGLTSGKATSLSASAPYVAGGLDAQWFSQSDITTGIPTSTRTTVASPDSTNHGASMCFNLATGDNPPHYVRVEVIPQPLNNNYLWNVVSSSGTPFRYVDVKVSYQTVAGVGYASRGVPMLFSNAPRKAATH